MFKFFKSKQAKNKRHPAVDLYELNEQETEMLLGGSPVRYLLGGIGNHVPFRQRSTNMGFEPANYPPLNATLPHNTWQQGPSWVQVGEEEVNRAPNYFG
jgi:hypothetical protein